MKTGESTRHLMHLPHQFQSSLSLHTRIIKNKNKPPSQPISKNIDEIMVCIIFRKKKIQFNVKHRTTFEDLNRILYG